MKKIIVTGASGNMGKAIVRKFLAEGYWVIGTVIPGDPAVLDIEDTRFEKSVVDLLNEGDAGKFIAAIIERHKTIDATVLTVGGFAMGEIVDTKTSDITKQYKLNFETTYNIVRPVFAQMIKQQSGRIFMTGSRPGLDAQQGNGMTAYSLAKSLIFRLADLMNAETKGIDVVTSVVVPGTIDTSPNRKAMPDADFRKWTKAEDIAEIIYFYCTDIAKSIRDPLIKMYNNSSE
jgi:NAD(P)-dependent dehydrogenase (short-subunit alcohol dehydrogenase family)